MDKTIYLNVNQSSAVNHRKVYIKDIAEVYCSDTEIKLNVENIEIHEFKSEKAFKQVGSVCLLLDMIHDKYAEYQIQNLGETEFIIYYKPIDPKTKFKDNLKIAFVSIFAFFGAGFSIMTFNTDVATPVLFDKLYLLFTGSEASSPGILQIAYSIGLFLGIILFFNHGGRFHLTNDPSPLQVQMRQYEQSVNQTFITDADRNNDMLLR